MRNINLSRPSPDLRSALQQARHSLTDAAAKALALGLLSDDESVQIRLALKIGRSSRARTSTLQSGIEACRRITFALQARIPALRPAHSPHAPIEASAPKKSSESIPRELVLAGRGRRRRRKRQRGLRDVPSFGDSRRGQLATDSAGLAQVRAETLLTLLAEDEERLAEIATRMQLVRLIESGNHVRTALEKVGLDTGDARRRWAQRIYKQWRQTGTVADLRWFRSAAPTVLTPLVEAIILRIWNGRRGADAAAVHRLVEKEIKALHVQAVERGLTCDVSIPEYVTVQKYLANLPECMQLVREAGLSAWDKNARMVVTFDPTEYANEVWQLDHTRLDIWIRIETSPGVWEPAEVWMTAAIDVHSRAVMGWWLAIRHPNAWTTALVMRHAISSKDDPDLPFRGMPRIATPDHGADFMSHRVALLMRALGVDLEPTPPHYPNMKGEIERWFRTLNGYLAELVGAMENDGRSLGAARLRVPYLLTLGQLRAEVRGFIVDYHQRVHSSTGEAPLDRWQRTVRLSVPAEEELNVLMLQSDQTRRITKQGISFHVDGRGGFYLAEELQNYWRCDVRLRYNPEDLDSILVYDAATGEYICEAWLEGTRYSVDDVKRWRRGFRQELKQRTTAYFEQMQNDDRRSARAWDEAESKAHELRAVHDELTPPAERLTPPAEPKSTEQSVVSSLLDRFRRRDRGRGAA